jgi:hypothetical protein
MIECIHTTLCHLFSLNRCVMRLVVSMAHPPSHRDIFFTKKKRHFFSKNKKKTFFSPCVIKYLYIPGGNENDNKNYTFLRQSTAKATD